MARAILQVSPNVFKPYAFFYFLRVIIGLVIGYEKIRSIRKGNIFLREEDKLIHLSRYLPMVL